MNPASMVLHGAALVVNGIYIMVLKSDVLYILYCLVLYGMVL